MALSNRELVMINDTDVVGHIQCAAADIKAAAEEQGSTFYMVPTTLWAERGDYANVYEYERSMALGEYSDIHKEERGFRPREDLGNLTLEGIEALISDCFPSEPWRAEESALEEAISVERWRLDNLTSDVDDQISNSKWQSI
jgi:hypothetical protein